MKGQPFFCLLPGQVQGSEDFFTTNFTNEHE